MLLSCNRPPYGLVWPARSSVPLQLHYYQSQLHQSWLRNLHTKLWLCLCRYKDAACPREVFQDYTAWWHGDHLHIRHLDFWHQRWKQGCLQEMWPWQQGKSIVTFSPSLVGGKSLCCDFEVSGGGTITAFPSLCPPAHPQAAPGVETQQHCWTPRAHRGGLCKAPGKGFKYAHSFALSTVCSCCLPNHTKSLALLISIQL